ncbi:retrovirus-related pol polyprotein from transposon TNT 1-94, partial [Tanacetum coccineum]
EYYYVDHMNAILGVYTKLDEFTDLQCDYLDQVTKCQRLENELSKRTENVNNKSFNELSKRFSKLEQHSINLELALQQRVIPTTSVSRPQLKSTRLEDRVLHNNSQGKKQEVEDHQIILFIVDSGCSKHMTGNLKLLINFVEKFLGTVRFGNDQFAPILRYGDLVQGNVTIKRVYYVEGMNHNLFSVVQFCSRGTDLYSITLQDITSPNPICLMAKASSSQAWLWHHRLSYMNFDTINLLSKNDIVIGLPKLKFVKDHLCSSCELGKAKRNPFETKTTPCSKRQLQLPHMDLCGLMRVENINGKKYVLVIVDDYSRYTLTHFLRSKDETPEVLIDFLRLV